MNQQKVNQDATQDFDVNDINREEVPSEGSVGGEGHRQTHEDLDVDYSQQSPLNDEQLDE